MPESTAKKAVIALGSNIGNRLAHIQQAVNFLRISGFRITMLSRVWETEPWGDTDQPRFLNMCLSADTDMTSTEALSVLKKIESDMGRQKTRRWGPREIDLDIIFFGDEIVHADKLIIPHPLMHERAFVLVPLAEIEPDMVHPIFKKTVKELLGELPSEKMQWIIKL